MKPQQQRIAIATACGWRIVHTTKYAWVVICPSKIERAWSSHDGVMNDKPASYYLPDYLNDLNSMHEAENLVLRSAQQGRDYADALDDGNGGHFATSAQRAEALLRTIGKWEDDK
jgi:hypothetical protein